MLSLARHNNRLWLERILVWLDDGLVRHLGLLLLVQLPLHPLVGGEGQVRRRHRRALLGRLRLRPQPPLLRHPLHLLLLDLCKQPPLPSDCFDRVKACSAQLLLEALVKATAGSDEHPVLRVLHSVEGEDGSLGFAKTDARVAAAAHRVGALGLDPTCCQRQAWQGGQVPGQVGRVGTREERLLYRL